MKHLWHFAGCITAVFIAGFTSPGAKQLHVSAKRQLVIRFVNYIGQDPLQGPDILYQNGYGEPFSVEQLKYYISDIALIAKDGSPQPIGAGPWLVDQAHPESRSITLSTTASGASALRFTIGMDSLANTGGVKTGDLDPMLGMFWTWNTGYIYFRIEGQSDSAHAPAHRFTWDIGGHKSPANTQRQVTLAIDELKDTLNIKADLLRLFDGAHAIRLSRSPICHQPGTLAMQLADNYATLFSLQP